jgi:protein-S-isoprenylcysteine O-methyltransferase Ste14
MMTQPSMFAQFVWGNWQVLLWTANAAWWLSELWIFARDFRRARGRDADRSSRLIIVLAVAASMVAALWCAGRFTFATLPNGEVGALRFAAGIIMMWLGIALRIGAVVTLGAMFRTTVMLQDDHRLVTRGLYSRLRNPSYTGALITVTGQGLTMGNWLALLVCVGGVLAALAWRIHVEEQALRDRFGESFEAYVKRSWAILPPLW